MKRIGEGMQPVEQIVDRLLIAHGNVVKKDGLTLRGPRNERDELFDFFYKQLSGPWLKFTKRPLRKAHLAAKIAHLKLPDLYYLKSTCIDAENRGMPFSKAFWGSLKPRVDNPERR